MPTANTPNIPAIDLPLPDPLSTGMTPYRTAIPKPPLTSEERENLKKPKVLIVGAGIGGLTLGNLLQKGGIPYLIVERAKEVKPLGKHGSANSVCSSLSNIFHAQTERLMCHCSTYRVSYCFRREREINFFSVRHL